MSNVHKSYSRKDIKSLITPLISFFKNPTMVLKKSNSEYFSYYCSYIMKLVEILVKFGKVKDLAVQHEIFKYIIGEVFYQGNVEYEIQNHNRRSDIMHIINEEIIELKVITEVTNEKIKDKIEYVYKYQPTSDKLWLIFFHKIEDIKNQKINEKDNNKENCKYLLTMIVINIMEMEELSTINNEVIEGLDELLDKTSKEIKVKRELIIPLGNVVISEELKREVAEKNRVIEEKDRVIEEKDRVIEEKDRIIKEKEKEINLLKEQLQLLKRNNIKKI